MDKRFCVLTAVRAGSTSLMGPWPVVPWPRC